MVIEKELPPLWEWLPSGALQWAVVVGALALVVLLAGLLVVTLRYGPVRGARITWRRLREIVLDVAGISPRRIGALAWLALKESIRRRVVVVLIVFVLVLAFAAWFLDPESERPAALTLGFVLDATSFLVLLLALFLSATSLPADIRNRTLHTVVTKPVRASEIVLGRIGGFVLVGTLLLAVMSVLSYVFVLRLLDHAHEVRADELEAVAGTAGDRAGTTELAKGHRHKLYVHADGRCEVETERGHTHALNLDPPGSKASSWTGPPEGMLLARVPIYGKLRFRDRDGIDKEKGINVGDEWVYRSYIQGQTAAAAIWTFRNIREDRFPDGFLVEMNIGVFRTYKGDIVTPVRGSLKVRNPRTGLTVEVHIFRSKEFVPFALAVPRKIVKPFKAAAEGAKPRGGQMIARKIETPEGIESIPAQMDESLAERTEFDLFEDLVTSDGEVEIWLQCIDGAQYFGAGQPDLYILARDASFTVNFFKGYLGIWLQMVLITAFGVMFSTFLSAPVAMMATAGVIVAGLFKDYMVSLALGKEYGGGPVEAFLRLITQANVVTPLEPSLRTTVVQMADAVAEFGLRVISALIPPITEFDYGRHVADGFDIAWDPWIAIPTLRALGFVVPLFVVGCLFLKTREVAR
ncbi:MAG: hypothetical protein ACUVUC_01060 [Thermoguttaceae bacterium]